MIAALVVLLVVVLGASAAWIVLTVINWRQRRGTYIPPQPAVRVPLRSRSSRVRAVPAAPRTRTTPSGRLRVEADRRPLWEARGWRRDGSGRLVGAYRTRIGACRGEITVDASMRPREFYILNPPELLLRDPQHGPCFRRRRGGHYWIHFSLAPATIDAGITQVEHLLRAALSRR